MATSMPVPKQRQPRTYKRTCEKTRASELVDRRLQAPSPPLHDPKRTVCPRAAGWRRLVVPEALDRGHQNLLLQPIPRLENPPHGAEAQPQKQQRHPQAEADAHVGDAVEAPAEAADQVDDG